MSYGARVATVMLGIGFGAMLAPACTIHLRPGGAGGGNGIGQGDTTGGETSGAGGSGGGADPFAGIDPQELDKASLKAGAFGYQVFGLVNSSGFDPGGPDQAAIDALVDQAAPAAEAAVNSWIATLDPSTIAAGHVPRYDCTEQHKCPYVARCSNGPFSGVQHNCWVTDCGTAACGQCPDWFPDNFKGPVFKSWCAYVCTNNKADVVAIGVAAVDNWAGLHPEHGPLCLAP